MPSKRLTTPIDSKGARQESFHRWHEDGDFVLYSDHESQGDYRDFRTSGRAYSLHSHGNQCQHFLMNRRRYVAAKICSVP